MKDIAEAIKEKRAAILRLQGELDVLEQARALLDGGSAEQLTGTTSLKGRGVIQGKAKAKLHPRKGQVSPKSAVGQTIAVLREGSVPLHISDILARLEKRGLKPKKASLGSSLAKLSKRGVWFYRANQPNTFGLLEWEKAKATA